MGQLFAVQGTTYSNSFICFLGNNWKERERKKEEKRRKETIKERKQKEKKEKN